MKLFHLLLAAALVAAASAACSDCEAASGDVVKPLTCTSATVALTCPANSVLVTNSAGDKASCVKCSADTVKCTAGADFTTAKTVSTECSANFGVKATTPATCVACTAAVSSGSDDLTLLASKCTVASDGTQTAVTCPDGSVKDAATCIKCSANTKACTKGASDRKTVNTVSTECDANYGVKAGTPATCVVCTAAVSSGSDDLTLQASKCTVASGGAQTAVTCPIGSVKDAATCIKCSANTVECTKGASDRKTVNTVSTKCAVGKYVKAGTPATCDACASITCEAGKQKTKAVTQCAAGTSTANASKATDCEACSPNAATCETTLAKGAKTCDTGYQLNDSAAENCGTGKFGEKVKVCVATCGDADKTKITAAGGCMCDTTLCAKDKACNDKKCAAPVTKKSPASTLQASALLSAAALLVALRQ